MDQQDKNIDKAKQAGEKTVGFINNLFDNPGKKIQNYSKILFVIISLCSILYGLSNFRQTETSYSYYGYSSYTSTTYNWIIFFIFVIVIPVSTYISSLFMCAFGELVENSHKMTDSDHQ